MIELTDEARERISAALASKNPPVSHLRIGVTVSGPEFEYRLEGVAPEDVRNDDTRLAHGDFEIVVDPESLERIRGTRIDYRTTLVSEGFHFQNPNRPTSPELPSGARTDLSGPVGDRVRMLLDTEINPAIAAHGGFIQLIEVKDNRAYVSFGGGCHGCGLVDVTLKEGIETRIREAIPEIVEVVDTTDHESGANPFYV